MVTFTSRLLLAYCAIECLLAEDFRLWDYCQQTTTTCEIPLGVGRFTVGSGYEQGSDKWYLVGGQITNDFYYTATVAVVDIPSTSDDLATDEFSNCSSLYPNNLPQGVTQSFASVINDELYSFGGFTEFNGSYYYLSTSFNTDTSTKSDWGMTMDSRSTIHDPSIFRS